MGYFLLGRNDLVKYKYDADTMIEKIRETWSPEDFLQATKNLMYTKKQ